MQLPQNGRDRSHWNITICHDLALVLHSGFSSHVLLTSYGSSAPGCELGMKQINFWQESRHPVHKISLNQLCPFSEQWIQLEGTIYKIIIITLYVTALLEPTLSPQIYSTLFTSGKKSSWLREICGRGAWTAVKRDLGVWETQDSSSLTTRRKNYGGFRKLQWTLLFH